MTEQNDIPQGPQDPSLNVPPPPPLASDGATASGLASAGESESSRASGEPRMPTPTPLDAPDLSHRSPDIPPPVPDRNPSEETAIREHLPRLPDPESIIPRSSMNVAGEQTMVGIGNDQQTAIWDVWPRPTFIAKIVGVGNGTYAFQEQCHNAGVVNFVGGRTGNLTEINGVTIANGTNVVVSMLRGKDNYGYYTQFGGNGTGGALNVGYYYCDSGGGYIVTMNVNNLYFGGPSQSVAGAHDIGYVHPEIAVNSGGVSPNFTYYGHVWRLTVANATYLGASVFPCSAIFMDNSATGDDAVELTVADGGADGAGFGTSTGKKANVSAKIKNLGAITLTTHWDNAAPGDELGSQAPTKILYLKDQANGVDGTGKFIGTDFTITVDAPTKKVTATALARAGLNDLTDVDLSANATYRDRTKHTMMLAYDANAGKWVRLLADEREVVTDVSWDAGNHTIKQTKRTLYVLGMQVGNATTSDVVVFEACP